MKGQFFLIGALVLIIILAGAVSVSRPMVKSPEDDLGFFFLNINSEYPKALNFGLSSGDANGTLQNFTEYVDGVMARHYINFTSVWVLLEGGTSSVHVTVGSHLKRDSWVQVDMTGTPVNMTVSDGSLNSTIITGVPSAFNCTITTESRTSVIDMVRDKVNFYAFFMLLRGKNFVKSEVIA